MAKTRKAPGPDTGDPPKKSAGKRRKAMAAEPVTEEEPGEEEAKPWRNRGRLALLDLEPQAEYMLATATPPAKIVAWCIERGATEAQAEGLIKGIRARWAECEQQTRADRLAVFRARLELAWNLATHAPIVDMFGKIRETDDGNIAVRADLQAVPKLLKLQMELDGLAAPTKHQHLHGHVNLEPRALQPAERRAEIERLLAKRQAALEAAKLKLPPGQPIDATASETR